MPSFSLQGWHPLSRTPISSFLQTTLLSAGVHGNVSELELQLLLLVLEFQTISLKPRATGQAKHIKIIIYCMYVLWWTMYGAYLLLCLALLSVFRFAHSYRGSVFHQPLACLLPGPWPPRLGMGAHGWVARICQALEQSSSRSWLPIKEPPGYLRHTTSTPRGGC